MTREEAINLVKQVLPCLNVDEKIREGFKTLIPELAENEDERIIKTLQEYVKNRNWSLNGPTQDEVLAWLEKQKGHQENCTKFCSGHCAGCERNEQKPSIFPPEFGEVRWNPISSVQQKPAEYLDKDKIYAIMKKLHDLSFSKDILINSKEYKQINEITHDVRSLLDYPINQQPAEWSKEDERCWNLIWDILDGPFIASESGYKKARGWFIENCPKGYKHPQSHWKPTDHQMTILKAVKDYVGKGSGYWGEGLGSLIDDLEKL